MANITEWKYALITAIQSGAVLTLRLQNILISLASVSYEDRTGAKYSYTNVIIVGADKESYPEESKFDARHLFRNSSAASK